MSLKNKSKDMRPFDIGEKPRKQSPLLMPLIWGASFLMTRKFHLMIERIGMEKIKPPYLVLSTHQGFSDYYIAPLAIFPHRAIYVSDMEGFAAFGKNLYQNIGCIGKRRYVTDTRVMMNIHRAISMGQNVVIFPESRHSNIGINADIPTNMGKVCKYLDIPVVTLSVCGSYLANPFWNEEKTRSVPMKAIMECVYTRDELRTSDTSEIQKTIVRNLTYDEYDYQHSSGILIKDKDRAEGIEKALFCCESCGKKYGMRSIGIHLSCQYCSSEWELTEDGWLCKEQQKISPPDWYRKQQEIIISEIIDKDLFYREFKVKVEALPNEKGFVELGEGLLQLDNNSFTLTFKDITGSEQKKTFPHKIRESVQTEYNYRNKGPCIVLSDRDCCYYIYSEDQLFSVTELQFIGEALYKKIHYRK